MCVCVCVCVHICGGFPNIPYIKIRVSCLSSSHQVNLPQNLLQCTMVYSLFLKKKPRSKLLCYPHLLQAVSPLWPGFNSRSGKPFSFLSPCHLPTPLQDHTSLYFPVAQMVKNLPAVLETRAQSLGWKDPLEKGMATHSSILARRIPWMEEPGGLQSPGSRRVGHNWATDSTATKGRQAFLFSLAQDLLT